MELRRRFVFRGNAAAFGGRFVRPADVTLEMPGASCLPGVGGRSVWTIEGAEAAKANEKFKGYLSFESASTFAEGKFDDLKQAIELTHRKVREETLATTTLVRAEITGLTIGSEKRVTAGRLAVALESTNPKDRGEAPISVTEIIFEDFKIDGIPLAVDFDRKVFNEHDTHAKVVRAAASDQFGEKYRKHFFVGGHVTGQPRTGGGRLSNQKQIVGTLVSAIDRNHPVAIKEEDQPHHSVFVANFGRIFFGEVFISENTRRVMLVRFELGSDGGGSAGGPEVDTNGGYSP